MKLIKLSNDHFIIVDDSEIKEGDWVLTKEKSIHQVDYVDAYTKINGWKKITHSTKILGSALDNSYQGLLISEVKELLGEVDVEKKAWRYNPVNKLDAEFIRAAYISGYNQSLKDNKEKKYTEEDLSKAIEYVLTLVGNHWSDIKYESDQDKFNSIRQGLKEIIQSLQPKTEWEVKIVDGKIKLI